MNFSRKYCVQLKNRSVRLCHVCANRQQKGEWIICVYRSMSNKRIIAIESCKNTNNVHPTTTLVNINKKNYKKNRHFLLFSLYLVVVIASISSFFSLLTLEWRSKNDCEQKCSSIAVVISRLYRIPCKTLNHIEYVYDLYTCSTETKNIKKHRSHNAINKIY